jgi:hypothetical protein
MTKFRFVLSFAAVMWMECSARFALVVQLFTPPK